MNIAHKRRRTAGVVAVTLGMVAGIGLGAVDADQADAGSSLPVTVADASDESQDFPFPGPDTIALHDGSGKYITYGASQHGRKVPYSIHGSGNFVGTSPTIDGDAMPGGGGAWVNKDKGIWTPAAFYHKSRYYLFYTATNKSTGQHCIGVAYSTSPTSNFVSQPTPIACPAKENRWAIDADVTRGPNGGIWMTWRDGQRANGPESALSAVLLKFHDDGTVKRASTARVILRSDNLKWPDYNFTGNVTVIENPVAFYNAGSWYLFYSGNSWQSNYYSTGIAFCGAKLGDNLCTPMPGPNRAWFSYSGPEEHLPDYMRKRGLPGNKRGPGAMDVYRARDGQPWVTWNYLSDSGGRKSRTGVLHITGTGSSADFRVTLS